MLCNKHIFKQNFKHDQENWGSIEKKHVLKTLHDTCGSHGHKGCLKNAPSQEHFEICFDF